MAIIADITKAIIATIIGPRHEFNTTTMGYDFPTKSRKVFISNRLSFLCGIIRHRNDRRLDMKTPVYIQSYCTSVEEFQRAPPLEITKSSQDRD